MASVTNEMIYTVLQQIEAKIIEIQSCVVDNARQLTFISEDFKNFKRNTLRMKAQMSDIINRLDRIETRLSLSDA